MGTDCQQPAGKAGTGLHKASCGDCWELSGTAHLNLVGGQGDAEEWTLVWQLCDWHCRPLELHNARSWACTKTAHQSKHVEMACCKLHMMF